MAANTAQAQAWKREQGRHFVAENARHERMLEPHTARMLEAAKIRRADSVLDVGCGCGETTMRVGRAAWRGHALGVDLSAVMLAEARRLAASERIGNTRFEQADAQTHPYPAAGFDVVLSRFGLMFSSIIRRLRSSTSPPRCAGAADWHLCAGRSRARSNTSPSRSRPSPRTPPRPARS